MQELAGLSVATSIAEVKISHNLYVVVLFYPQFCDDRGRTMDCSGTVR